MFSSVPARMIRTAISARFAASTFLKGGSDDSLQPSTSMSTIVSHVSKDSR